MELSQKKKELDTQGRMKMKRLCEQLNLGYAEPTNKKLAYDCYISYRGKIYIVELKDRDPRYEQYDELILEQDKYNRVKSWEKRLNAAGSFYINFFGDTAYIFNLNDDRVTQKPDKRWMNAVTVESRKKKTLKAIYLVDKKYAKKITIRTKILY